MKFIDSKLAKVLLSIPLTGLQKGLRYIFVYHDVSNSDSPLHHPVISTQTDVFEKQIRFLKSKFKLVSLSDLVDNKASDVNCAAVVFDDGYRSVLSNAYPILRREQVPFNVFINKNAVLNKWLWGSNVLMAEAAADESYLRKIYDFFSFDKMSYESFRQSPTEALIFEKKLKNDYSIFFDENYAGKNIYMDTSEIYQLLEAGCEFGSHTANHKVLSLCDDDALNEEIAPNADFVKQLTGNPTKHFAIPFGFEGTYDTRAVDLAKKHHSYIYTTDRNYFRHASSIVPRIGLRNESVKELKQVINLPVAIDLRNKLFNR